MPLVFPPGPWLPAPQFGNLRLECAGYIRQAAGQAQKQLGQLLGISGVLSILVIFVIFIDPAHLVVGLGEFGA